MRPVLALFVGFFLFSPTIHADEPVGPDGTPIRNLRGLLIIRQGDTTTVSLGGGIFRRRVKVITQTPDGPVVTPFTLPSDLHGPNASALPEAAPAQIRVAIPDSAAVLYVEGELLPTSGTLRQLESPPLPPGKTVTLHLRAGWLVGDKILIEDRQILIRAGDSSAVTFDGSRALTVPATTR